MAYGILIGLTISGILQVCANWGVDTIPAAIARSLGATISTVAACGAIGLVLS